MSFNLPIYHMPHRTGFEESKHLKAPPGTVLAGKYEVLEELGEAAFSTGGWAHTKW